METLGITWFDAALVALWAGVFTLCLRRGVGGVAWALALLVIWPLITFLSARNAVLALPAALILGWLVTWLPRAVAHVRLPEAVQWVLGGLSGAVLGLAVTIALLFSFPIRLGTYPSSDLPPSLYRAVGNSYLLRQFSGLWQGPELLQRYVMPDRVRP
ncbi:putative membrane-anchored protein [Deinobacterium chartae]|uniref:Putative membrane-anchored protein n=1 Tax=Deinobacterium chartae TaxID=521158 RepID=A0A841HZ00_9DEIO|nr:hypothetical protein [Deinobacterium chartae]MBB6098133.1 putative membrane-anchored protein [Deinobacterium chartae]